VKIENIEQGTRNFEGWNTLWERNFQYPIYNSQFSMNIEH
jgi:hypothetical protein